MQERRISIADALELRLSCTNHWHDYSRAFLLVKKGILQTMLSSIFARLLNETSGLIPGLRPANERHRYKVPLYLIGWAQT